MREPAEFDSGTEPEYGITFKEGRLLFIKEEKSICLNCPIVLVNGIIINTDGLVRFSDGTNITLKEGEIFSAEKSYRYSYSKRFSSH